MRERERETESKEGGRKIRREQKRDGRKDRRIMTGSNLSKIDVG